MSRPFDGREFVALVRLQGLQDTLMQDPDRLVKLYQAQDSVSLRRLADKFYPLPPPYHWGGHIADASYALYLFYIAGKIIGEAVWAPPVE